MARLVRICELVKDWRIGTTAFWAIGRGGVQASKALLEHLLLSKHFRVEEFRNPLVDLPQFFD
jgi:hypothetical protein